jgi:hypothetical protein
VYTHKKENQSPVSDIQKDTADWKIYPIVASLTFWFKESCGIGKSGDASIAPSPPCGSLTLTTSSARANNFLRRVDDFGTDTRIFIVTDTDALAGIGLHQTWCPCLIVSHTLAAISWFITGAN